MMAYASTPARMARDTIAKIIDPEAFVPMEDVIGMRKAYAKADEILATHPAPVPTAVETEPYYGPVGPFMEQLVSELKCRGIEHDYIQACYARGTGAFSADILIPWLADRLAQPDSGGVVLSREALLALIMEETTDDIVADGWERLGKPNILVQGCRYVRRKDPAAAGEGYENPETSAKQFAGFIADRILAALAPVAAAADWQAEAWSFLYTLLGSAPATAADILQANPEVRATLHQALYERQPLGAETYAAMMARLCPHGLPTEAPVGGEVGALTDIATERQRQINVEGWSISHDDEHDEYQLARAAGCYALHAGRWTDDERSSFVDTAVAHGWPWDKSWWKPKDRRTDLVRAAALIVAEVERLDRAALRSDPADNEGGA